MNTFEEILDLVTELPLEQQEQLIEIVKRRATDIAIARSCRVRVCGDNL